MGIFLWLLFVRDQFFWLLCVLIPRFNFGIYGHNALGLKEIRKRGLEKSQVYVIDELP